MPFQLRQTDTNRITLFLFLQLHTVLLHDIGNIHFELQLDIHRTIPEAEEIQPSLQ